jgi:thiol-disulfide isomerase/thioredoxin
MCATRPILRAAPLAAAAALLLAAATAAAVEAGDAAPSFRAPTLQDSMKSLALEDYRGKVVFLDFWASWCAPCATSLPVLDSFRREFGPDEFAVLAVNVDANPAKGRDFLSKRPVGYPSVTDPEGKLPIRFGIETMPTSFLIDRKGVIRLVHRGFKKTDADALRAEIRKLVSGR